MNLPEKALSIMQPWAWLIVNGRKDIENRDWTTRYRGPVAIHAGKKGDKGPWHDLVNGIHPVTGERLGWSIDISGARPPGADCGGIVGVAEIVDCVDSSGSPWFVGRYGFVIRNARPVPFIPVKGALGFFKWQDRRL
ncbi:ASCH domain-containing protein [Bradyrhizobium sp. 186]|uniref:ASCH domain-containing protein n=1 Tax=Bradyrhizobium sp. 186 TaxID=2782654 RepID=UPI002000C20B|nr:ASCH domain-containing protein [Bradyrhizobium sp. 186]UPK31846.1 ASCH domain-containing protein [Bradyrhizobium sp. 186]